ncbi:MAG: ABC transporter permease [Candidatus Fermentibacteraceae bacterium]
MTARAERAAGWRRQAHGALVVLKKNALLYYLKPPVLIFGVLFPVFFYIAFRMGRPVPSEMVVPGMVAMALWFTASAVGPLVTPWERTAKTYERLISTPLGVPALLAGDVLSGFLFGIVISALPVALGLLLTEAAVESRPLLAGGTVLSALCFSSMGVLLAAPPVRGPSNIMLLSNLVRLPLIFVSGVFVPLLEMPVWVRWVAPVSPLTYGAAAIRSAFGQTTWLSPGLSLAVLVAYSGVLFGLACMFHRMGRSRGL